MGLFGYIILFLVLYFFVKTFIRPFIRVSSNGDAGNYGQPYGGQRETHSKRAEGQIHIDSTPENTVHHHRKADDGEYVDFQEVK